MTTMRYAVYGIRDNGDEYWTGFYYTEAEAERAADAHKRFTGFTYEVRLEDLDD